MENLIKISASNGTGRVRKIFPAVTGGCSLKTDRKGSQAPTALSFASEVLSSSIIIMASGGKRIDMTILNLETCFVTLYMKQ
ncbi:hypothetical protein TSAR_003536 [Trichomalopsis sarcophagae]|uniref:Uncharacterized protein n=1 Tax=Trichomalopsis sarcophagae TaxID=543379 RepID=A0A232FES7_9HYME|nr:hypothetical protein TSAR_003536 [Trichomalopsis sarcophagae]